MSDPNQINTSALVELGTIKGQLNTMMTMLQQNHADTNRRIDDLRHAQEARTLGVENRVSTLEKNERGTAIKAAAAGAASGFIAAAAIAAIKFIPIAH
jgi:chromosome segregation ATPase